MPLMWVVEKRDMRSVLVIVALVAGCAGASAQGTPNSANPAYAIPNPLRPGAKATPCAKQGETPDGCTFHTKKDDVNRVRLPGSPDATWTARASEGEMVAIRKATDDAAADGARYQVFELVPGATKDADIVVTFDKLTGAPGALKVVERRRVSVMVHGS